MNSQLKVTTSSNLNSTEIENSFLVYTTDNNKLYVDTSSRNPVNAVSADQLQGWGQILPEQPSSPVANGARISYTWEELNAIALSGHAEDWVSVGAIKNVTLNGSVLGNSSHDVRIIGINQDNGKSITFHTVDSLNFTTYGSDGFWIGSTVRELCQNYYDIFPNKDCILPIYKGTAAEINVDQAAEPVYNRETVFLLSDCEAGLIAGHSATNGKGFSASYDEFSRDNTTKAAYSYYTDNDSRIKKINGSANYWWLRSLYFNDSNYVCIIRSNGQPANNATGRYSRGFAPAFVIGNPNSYIEEVPDLNALDILKKFKKQSLNECCLEYNSYTGTGLEETITLSCDFYPVIAFINTEEGLFIRGNNGTWDNNSLSYSGLLNDENREYYYVLLGKREAP